MVHEPFPVHVDDVELPFRCVDAGTAPGPAAAAQFARSWPAYRHWYLHEGEQARPSYADCRDAVRTHLPELADDYAAAGRRRRRRRSRGTVPEPLVPAAPRCRLLDRDARRPRTPAAAQLRLPTHALRRARPAHPLVGAFGDRDVRLRVGPHGRRQRCRPGGVDLLLAADATSGLASESGSSSGCSSRLRPRPPKPSIAWFASPFRCRTTWRSSTRSAIVASCTSPPIVRLASSYEVTVANSQGATEWPEHAEYCNTIEREAILTSLVSGRSRRPGRDRGRLPCPTPAEIAPRQHVGHRLHGGIRAGLRLDDPDVARRPVVPERPRER